MRRLMLVMFLLWGMQWFPTLVPHAWAQTASTSTSTEQAAPFDSRRLLVQHRNADGTVKLPAFWQDPVLWIRGEQQNFYAAISNSLHQIQQENSWTAARALMLISLAYGVFHAAGPGHGKAVISAWVLATRSQLRRGILIAFMSAFVQAVTAVTAVSLLLWLVEGVASATKNISAVLESASFAMIAAMGGYLLWPALKPYVARKPVTLQATQHFEIINPLPAGPGHLHGPDCGCDHAHLPSAEDVAGEWSWTKAAAMAFAVGIRPCTGALLVLVSANAMGLYWAGVASTFIMALGTFVTVSAVATMAVYARKFAEGLAQHQTRWLGFLNTSLRLGGGAAIMLFGLLLFWDSLSGPVGNM